jgi:hypothetical protein
VKALAVSLCNAFALALACTATAGASQFVTRNAGHPRLAVNAKGEALVTYAEKGATRHALVWGAKNALPPTQGRHQVRFKVDYSGGWTTHHTKYWQTFRNVCLPYTGPALDFFAAACDAPDGSHWALQAWQEQLPDLGFTPWTPLQRSWDLHVSHWSGPLPKLEVWTDWVYSGRYQQVFGRFSYDGQPIYGFATTRTGAPTDGYGRLIFLDTYNSRYGPGWRRENSFVSHNPTGIWCYGFFQFDATLYPHPKNLKEKMRGPGTGEKYRLSADGPGVTPDVSVIVPGLHDYNPNDANDVAYERQQNALLDSIIGVDKQCRQH